MNAPEPVVILGAGLAGLSFADALLERDPAAHLVLIDRRVRWDRDRTWATWLTDDLRHADLARHRWARWRVASRGREVIRHSAAHPYIAIDPLDLYARVLDRIDRAPGAELRAGRRVTALHRGGGALAVETDRGTVAADIVVDAMGPASPLTTPGRPTVRLTQRFLGWEIETEADVFDPTVVTLMDFRGRSHDALNFIYVLPFSARHALVEHTSIGAGAMPAASRRDALADELGRRCGRVGWRLLREEPGVIAMTDAPYPESLGPRVHVIGAAGGAVRPSSGYAFTRTQRQVQRLAGALTGAPAMTPPAASRRRVLDRVFLHAIASAGDGGEELLWALLHRGDADALARFMADASSIGDELEIVRALPALGMLGPLARVALSAAGYHINTTC